MAAAQVVGSGTEGVYLNIVGMPEAKAVMAEAAP
jgi:hypothetical protein